MFLINWPRGLAPRSAKHKHWPAEGGLLEKVGEGRETGRRVGRSNKCRGCS